MDKMKHLSALGNAWQLATYVGMVFENFHVTLSYTEERAVMTIFDSERSKANLDEIRDWIIVNKVPYDYMELRHIFDDSFRVLDITWQVK